MSKKCKDIIIMGGGLTGLCLAPILGKLNLKITLIDKDLISSKKNINLDQRTVAISYGTKLIFERHSMWQNIFSDVEIIKNIKVLNRDFRSNITFDNYQKDDPMGYIIKHSILKKYLLNEIKLNRNIDIIENNKIVEVIRDQNYISVLTKNNKKICAKILIAADGKNSFVKSIFKIPVYKFKYNQKALTVNFEHTINHKNTAYEIFLPNGPLATLPMISSKKNIFKSSLIWSEGISTANYFLKIKEGKLKKIIEEKISPYLGKVVRLDKVSLHPLSAHICRRFFDNRVVLIGDSAHSIHPIAGQGWNLGMRDIKYFYDTLEEYLKLGIDIGSKEVLKTYNDKRTTDVLSMFIITHGLNKIFSSKSITVNSIRSLGFNLINNNKKLNKMLVKYAMGINL